MPSESDAIANELFANVVTSTTQSLMKWNATTLYSHTAKELAQIRDGVGIVPVYHGCPEELAEATVKNGFTMYRVDDLARAVAAKYGIPIRTFREYAPRAQLDRRDTMKISTAPALIAFRWASNFKFGEMLSDFDSHARVIVEANRVRHMKHISLSDAYELVLNKAEEIFKEKGIQRNYEADADILGLPDKFVRKKSTGAIIKIIVPAKVVQEHHGHDAGLALEHHDWEQYPILGWNSNYRDIKIEPKDIIRMLIVVKNIPYHATDIIHDESLKRYIDYNTGRIRGLKPRSEWKKE
jgi:hypothetical protein